MDAEERVPEAPSRPLALFELAVAVFLTCVSAALFFAMPQLIAEGASPPRRTS